MNQRELDDSFSDAAPGFVVCTFSMLRYHTVVRTAADRRFWYKFRKAQKTPTRRVRELAPDFPSTATSLYEDESREADAKLTELRKQKKPGEKVAYSRGDTVNSPLPESCVLFVRIYSAQSLPIGPFTGPHKTAWIDPPGYSQVSVKQRKWVGWKTRVDNAKSAGPKRPVGVRFPPGTVQDHGKNPLCGPTFDPPQ